MNLLAWRRNELTKTVGSSLPKDIFRHKDPKIKRNMPFCSLPNSKMKVHFINLHFLFSFRA